MTDHAYESAHAWIMLSIPPHESALGFVFAQVRMYYYSTWTRHSALPRRGTVLSRGRLKAHFTGNSAFNVDKRFYCHG